MNMRPFIEQVQQKLSKHFSKPVPPSNQLRLATRAESRAWIPVQTPEQEASYEDESWLNSTPSSTHLADLDTVASMPAVRVEDRRFTPRIRTVELKPLPQTTDSLRLGNLTDPWIPSIRTTPHELPIVPRQRSTAQLPPRLGDDTADSPEHVTTVKTLINQAIVTFHQEHQRLPHGITVSLIRFYQHWLDHHYSLFTYKSEYGNVQIPIRAGAKGELLTDEVRLD